MAYIEILPVKTRDHLANLLNYTANLKKTQNGKLLTYEGCQDTTAYNDFETVRKQSGKTGGILAHQMIQSFAPGEVDPETAHQVGVELARQMLPGFQFSVATHVDRNHVHNHIVFNSVSAATGMKYHSNLASLALMRDAGDKLCLAHGLSIIQNPSGYRGLDKTTYELAAKGKSWKVGLCADLDDILKGDRPPRNMRQFVKALQKREYDVRVTDRHITVKKRGEKKGIRLDTLARQFGVEYTKVNIERVLEGLPPDMTPFPTNEIEPDPTIGEASRAEAALFAETPSTEKTETEFQFFTPTPRRRDAKLSGALRHRRGMQSARSFSTFLIRAAQLGLDLLDPETRAKYDRVLWMQKARCGNCTYAQMKQMYGENVSVVLSAEQFAKINDLPILYSGLCREDGTVQVTFKAQHRPLVSGYLGIPTAAMKVKTEWTAEKNSREYLKQVANTRPKEKRLSYSCTMDELQILQQSQIPHDFFLRRDETLQVGFMSGDLQIVCRILQWDYADKRTQLQEAEARKQYRMIKTLCESDGVKIAYRVMSPDRLEQLQKAGVSFAAFPAKREGYCNVAMHPKDLPHYDAILQKEQASQQIRAEVTRQQEQEDISGKKPRRSR